jgi:hypothetical protein
MYAVLLILVASFCFFEFQLLPLAMCPENYPEDYMFFARNIMLKYASPFLLDCLLCLICMIVAGWPLRLWVT